MITFRLHPKNTVRLSAPGKHPIGIAMRIALLSWLVGVTTLLVFVFWTIPLQKRFFLENLESKANSVVASLKEAAAGAAVNEDFASIVSTGQTMLEGDPDLEFLIVMKNDGFSLVLEQGRWRVEPKIDPYWHSRQRKPTGGILTVPVFNRRVFHYAQPFDYSGIQWGWIHAGLSLKSYDHNVSALYINTVMLALGCLSFCLLLSLLYARRVVKPIHRLQLVVGRIAGGDLSIRADKFGHDELGSLAASVNTMADALQRRDHILESIRFAADKFMRTPRWQDAIDTVLEKIGKASQVSRVYIFENSTDDAGMLFMSQRYEWVAQGIAVQLDNPLLQNLSYEDSGFSRWCELLGKNEIIPGPVAELPAIERLLLEAQDIRSILVIPIFVESAWWGFLGFDDCFAERLWTDGEKDSLRAGADMLGATISRQRFQEALMEAKATLEQRVRERTRELREQIIAKEQALTELSAAQSSLLELSRAAGMAEVATGVLHNVGNVLNSVNVSCTLLMDQLRQSRVGNVSRLADLMARPEGGLAGFLTEDPRGRRIPEYLTSLAAGLEEEHREMLQEAMSLQSRVEHVKEIVAMQQSYGGVSGVTETVSPEQLMEDALTLHAEALARHGVAVQRRYQPAPAISVDKHKVLQILLNLIHNAKYACTEGGGQEKTIILSVGRTPGSDRVVMQVSDNGTGILGENLTRIFQHGFTTRKNGHGYGLHSGALAARDLGGSLSVHSDGSGAGATFTLELPIAREIKHDTSV